MDGTNHHNRYHNRMQSVTQNRLVRALALSLAAVLVAGSATAPVLAQPTGLPSLGSPAGADLSPQLERKLGEAIMMQGRRDPTFIQDAEITQYLNRMGHKLAAFVPSGAPDIDVFGVRDPIINAFAMPGGFIGINTGLIVATGNESELAGVMAHEIAHVSQRHIARGLTQQKQSAHIALAAIAASLLAAMTGQGQLAAGVAAFGQAAAVDRQLGFSRDAEREADRVGFEMLRKAGYDPNGMAQMFGRLMNASRLNEGMGGGVYATTHPLSIDRMTDMQNRARQHAAARYRDSDDYWYVRAKSRIIQAEDPQLLRASIDQLSDETRTQSGVRRSAAWYGLSVAALRQKKTQEAARNLDQAVAGQPASHFLALQKVDIELARKDFTAALQTAQEGFKRWPDQRALALRVGMALQLLGRDKDAVEFLAAQVKRWPTQEPQLYQMLANGQERLGKMVDSRQSMSRYYLLTGAFVAAMSQLQQARGMTQDFYQQSQIDVEIRLVRQKMVEERQLLERFKS